MRRVATATALLLVGCFLRQRMLRWGSTDAERSAAMPGDDLLRDVRLTATRAITIRASSDDVWPWIVQLGQGRGGFYSYDALENLARCEIHSADVIVPEWQHIDVGSEVRLAPDVALTVAMIEPNTALVLRGGIPMGRLPVPYDFTWAFALRAAPNGSARLVIRERYTYLRRWAPLIVEPAQVVSSVMSRRMLRGIKQRAEHAAGTPTTSTAPEHTLQTCQQRSRSSIGSAR